jgi:hypothetical protein
VLGGLAEFERELIKARTGEGPPPCAGDHLVVFGQAPAESSVLILSFNGD